MGDSKNASIPEIVLTTLPDMSENLTKKKSIKNVKIPIEVDSVKRSEFGDNITEIILTPPNIFKKLTKKKLIKNVKTSPKVDTVKNQKLVDSDNIPEIVLTTLDISEKLTEMEQHEILKSNVSDEIKLLKQQNEILQNKMQIVLSILQNQNIFTSSNINKFDNNENI